MPSAFMLAKLAASGLDPADVDATDAVSPYNTVPSGFRLPYYRPDGTQHPHMYRIRLESPAPGHGKYTQPSAAELIALGHPATDATHPYLNPYILGGLTWAGLAPHRKRLLIVEGEIKAASAGKLLKMAALGIPGCWGGTTRNPEGIFHVHPVIKGLIRGDDYVEVILDGDILTNPDVNRAAGTLKRALLRLGVKAVFVLLPAPVPGRGAGLDDWLMDQPDGTRNQAYEALPRTYGDEFDEDWISVADAFGLATNKQGIALPTVSNLKRIMEKDDRYKARYFFDVMRGNIYRNDPSGPRPFVDSFVFDEQDWLQRRFGMVVPKQTTFDAMRWLADQPRWHRNILLEALPDWDNVPRLEQMFVRGWGAKDDEYTRAVGKNWLVSAMARANVAGCKVDTMLVLIGAQGIKKTKSLEVLAGTLYIATHAQVTDKDFIMSLHRGWMIDLAELSSMNHSDAAHIKGIITNATDHIRLPYDATISEKPRHSIMVGTTNEDRFLRDGTGNRRFWPVACGTIDLDWIEKNRMQLLAEAQAAYLAGQTWWDMPNDATLAAQAARLEIGPWDGALDLILSGAHNFRTITVNGVSYHYITSEELLESLGFAPKDRKGHMFRDLASAVKRISGGKWEPYPCAQRIVMPGGTFRDFSRGYRVPVVGNVTGNVIAMPPRPLF